MVLNGGCKDKDLEHMKAHLESSGLDATIDHMDHLSLFALQGPKAAAALKKLYQVGERAVLLQPILPVILPVAFLVGVLD